MTKKYQESPNPDEFIKASAIVKMINSELKNRIQENIVWYAENIPANFPQEWATFFHSGKTLPDLVFDRDKNNTISFIDFYSALQQSFVLWSEVIKCTYRRSVGQYTNGGAITWARDEQTNYGYIASPVGNISSYFHKVPSMKNKVISVENTESFIDQLYTKWQQFAEDNRQIWEKSYCHSNCHSSCHKSGGRR